MSLSGKAGPSGFSILLLLPPGRRRVRTAPAPTALPQHRPAPAMEEDRRSLYIPKLPAPAPAAAEEAAPPSKGSLRASRTAGGGSKRIAEKASAPLKIRVVSGLGNRIRQLLGAYFVSQVVFKVPLQVEWKRDAACDSYFPELFEPIANLSIVDKGGLPLAMRGGMFLVIKQYLEKDGQGRLPPGWRRVGKDIRPQLGMSANMVSHNLFMLLQPQKELREQIDDYVLRHGISWNAVAIHARRTDQHGGGNKITSNAEFFRWIDKRTEEARRMRGSMKTGGKPDVGQDIKIFLATDNKDTQREFKDRYGDRLLVYSEIEETNAKRQTTVQHAVVDMFIAAHAVEFKGTTGTRRSSSFSAAIMQFWRSARLHHGMSTCSPSMMDTACFGKNPRGWTDGPHTLADLAPVPPPDDLNKRYKFATIKKRPAGEGA